MNPQLNPTQKLLKPSNLLQADVDVDEVGQPRNASGQTCAAAQINADAQISDDVEYSIIFTQ